jgi:hypothetical protein
MIVSHHSNNQPDRTLDYCVNIEILKIVTALQKIVLLKESLEHNKINKSTRNNRVMEASFSSKAKKIGVEASALNHEENYEQWLESQKEKIGKTIEEILAEKEKEKSKLPMRESLVQELYPPFDPQKRRTKIFGKGSYNLFSK